VESGFVLPGWHHRPIHHLQRRRRQDQRNRPRRHRHLHRLRQQRPRNRTRHLPRQLRQRHHAPGAVQLQQSRQHQVARHVRPATTDATGAAKFNALKTGSTYATGWGYNANSLATSIVTRETAAGATAAVETGRWAYSYDASNNLRTVKNSSVVPNLTATFSAYNTHGLPVSGQTHDGRSFQLIYRVTGELDRLTLSDGYTVQYAYSTSRQLLKATASDGWTADVLYDSSGFIQGLSTQQSSAQRAAASFATSAASAASVDAIPAPVPMPDWNDVGRLTGRFVGACAQRLGVLALLLTPSTIGACSTVDPNPNCKKPCPPCRTVSGKEVAVGTIAYRPLDTPPPGTTQHGVSGPHHNLFRANQAPQGTPKPCKCFWQPIGAVAPANLPAGSIPIEEFAN
jgi:hypothetical protein